MGLARGTKGEKLEQTMPGRSGITLVQGGRRVQARRKRYETVVVCRLSYWCCRENKGKEGKERKGKHGEEKEEIVSTFCIFIRPIQAMRHTTSLSGIPILLAGELKDGNEIGRVQLFKVIHVFR